MVDFETWYRAAESRDARFDGQFLIAVRTTGVYCRPTCPSRMPKAKNVVFFRAAAAAEAAGYRACHRCHPERAPALSPTTDDLAARALNLITAGVVDDVGVSGLASQLGVGRRHLHRLLTNAVGVGPLALAESRRSELARVLIHSTSLPLTEVAFAAGYSSLRRFNESLKVALGQTPSEYRRTTDAHTGSAHMPISLRLNFRPPLNKSALLAWYAHRAIEGLEYADGGTYARTVRQTHGHATVQLSLEDSGICILRATLTDIRDIGFVVRQSRDLFDLDCDPAAAGGCLLQDPALAPLVARRAGIRIPGSVDGVELAVCALLGQQVSVPAATTMAARLVHEWGDAVSTPDARLTHLFPSATTLAQAPLESIGITRRRATTVRSLARAVADGRLVLDRTVDWQETRERLLAIDGIGVWTADYISLRALRDPDAFPAGDLRLQRAAARLGLPESARGLEEYSARWRPWRAYAAMHLWSSTGEEPS